MTWYKIVSTMTNNEIVIKQIDKTTVESGIAEHMPEYLAWVADGNTAEQWQPIEQPEETN